MAHPIGQALDFFLGSILYYIYNMGGENNCVHQMLNTKKMSGLYLDIFLEVKQQYSTQNNRNGIYFMKRPV